MELIDMVQKSDNLIFMRKQMTATEVARNFSAVLDLVESGEAIEIYRGNKLVGMLTSPSEASDLAERMRVLFGDGTEPILSQDGQDFWEEILASRHSRENMAFRTSELESKP